MEDETNQRGRYVALLLVKLVDSVVDDFLRLGAGVGVIVVHKTGGFHRILDGENAEKANHKCIAAPTHGRIDISPELATGTIGVKIVKTAIFLAS